MIFVNTTLWNRVEAVPAYAAAISAVREISLALANKISEQLPAFTDHSVKHMDALWSVAEAVLTVDQINKLSSAEAFCLGLGFYTHDLGMALASTEDGLRTIRSTKAYLAESARLKNAISDSIAVDLAAVRYALRETHASQALDLVSRPLPGLERYLIENTEIREAWSASVGQVAASHHWSLEKVEREFGRKGIGSSPDGNGTIDMGYVACLLRIVDYAHINRERASTLELLLRPKISPESLIHWKAQNRIAGPLRDHDELKYTSTAPLDDIDAWWLFYDVATGLSNEIRAVHAYLRSRSDSVDRFTLFGVRGVESPEAFSHLVSLIGDLQPLDIKIQPHSMSRVLDILGGKALYGADNLAPVRELIQNSRDAISLRRSMEIAENRPITQGKMHVSMTEEEGFTFLTIEDNGVGMSKSTVLKHLLSVASDFWHSPDFFADYSAAVEHGFRPIGKFGIGFLSVFMLGDEVTIRTEAAAHSRLSISLKGLSRRGQLRETGGSANVGTSIRIKLNEEAVKHLRDLALVIRARAPLLDCQVSISTAKSTIVVEPEWWAALPFEEVQKFIENWYSIAFTGGSEPASERRRYRRFRENEPAQLLKWPGERPVFRTTWCKVWSTGVDEGAGVLICSNGVAVGVVPASDFLGIVECGPVELNASRNVILPPTLLRYQSSFEWPARWKDEVFPGLCKQVMTQVDCLRQHGLMPARVPFLKHLASVFGIEVLLETNAEWLPIATPDGTLRSCSTKEAMDILGRYEKLVLLIGGSYIDALKHVSTRVSTAFMSHAIVVPDELEKVDIDFSIRDRLAYEHGSSFKGTLSEIHEIIEKPGAQYTIAETFLDLLCSGWKLSRAELAQFTWECLFMDKSVLLILDKAEVSRNRSARKR